MKSRHLIELEALEFIEGLERPTLSSETLPAVRNYVKKTFDSADLQAPGITVFKTSAPGIQGEPSVPVIAASTAG